MSALTAAADTTLAKPTNNTTGQPINGDSTVMEGDVGWHVGRLAGADYDEVIAEITAGLQPLEAGGRSD